MVFLAMLRIRCSNLFFLHLFHEHVDKTKSMIDLIRETQLSQKTYVPKKIIESKINIGLSLGSVLMTRVLELERSQFRC